MRLKLSRNMRRLQSRRALLRPYIATVFYISSPPLSQNPPSAPAESSSQPVTPPIM